MRQTKTCSYPEAVGALEVQRSDAPEAKGALHSLGKHGITSIPAQLTAAREKREHDHRGTVVSG